MKIRFIFNPISGKSSFPVSDLQALIASHFPEAEFCPTTGPGHATELAQQAAQNHYDVVVAIGGDGTINETAKGLLHTSTALGILPRGSGNGFARELGLMGTLSGTLSKLKTATVRPCDVGFANGELFLNVAGVGIEATVAWQFMEQAKLGQRGMIPYFRLAAHTFFTYQPQTLHLILDGNHQEITPLTLVFANNRQYGSNFIIAPQANWSDGKLDLVEIKNGSKLKLAVTVPFFFLGKHLFGVTHTVRFTHAVLESPNEILYHIDGEPRETEHRLEINLQPGALRLLVP